MTKPYAIALFAVALMALTVRTAPPVTAAAVPSAPQATAVAAGMPAPQEPFDTTPIGAAETVGAARDE